jgi:hypothetical protein
VAVNAMPVSENESNITWNRVRARREQQTAFLIPFKRLCSVRTDRGAHPTFSKHFLGTEAYKPPALPFLSLSIVVSQIGFDVERQNFIGWCHCVSPPLVLNCEVEK